MNSASRTLRIEVKGLPAEQSAAQTLQNQWLAGGHDQGERLATLELSETALQRDVLEKLTWALLAWPEVEELVLLDAPSGRTVGQLLRVSPKTEANKDGKYCWRDHWLAVGVAEPANDEVIPLLDSFPPGRDAPSSWWQHFGIGVTGEAAIAVRERLKARLQRRLGKRVTQMIQHMYQGVGSRLRSLSSGLSCSVEPLLPFLTAMADTPGDGTLAVLMLVPRLSPGGAEKNAIELARQLADSGCRVCMVTTLHSTNSWTENALAAGVEVHHLPDFLPRHCWLTYLHGLVTARRIQVLHLSNSHWMYEHLPDLKERHPGLRVVTQLHAEGEAGTLDFPTLAARVDSWVDCHTVISEHLLAHMVERHGVPRDKIRLVRTGLDLSREFGQQSCRPNAWRDRNGIEGGRQLVCFVGRFSELKRPMLFLDIAEAVLQQHPDTLFVLKGEGPLLGAIERRVGKSAELANAVLIEDATSAVPPLLCDADLLVLPSLLEGISYVSYEAMALGVPQVSSDVGGQRELLGDGGGSLVEIGPGEVERFAAAVLALLEDAGLRQQMAQQASSRLSRWQTVSQMAAQYLSLYRSFRG